jgi:hypothetical protein
MKKQHLYYALILIVGLVFLFHPSLLTNFRYMPGELSDFRLNQYFLEHSWKLVSDRTYTGTLYSPSFFTPYPNALTFSDNLFGSAPIYWLFRSFLMPDMATMAWMVILSLLNFSSMVFVLRQEGVRPSLAGLGGFLFAFPIKRIAQLAMAQLFPQFCTPLCLWLAWRFAIKPSKSKWLLLLVLTYWQILCGIYLGWFLLLALLFFAITATLFLPESRQKIKVFFVTHWRFATSSLMVWGLFLYGFLAPYLGLKTILGGNPYESIARALPKPITFLMVPESSSAWSPLFKSIYQFIGIADPQTMLPFEDYNFPGLFLFVLTIGIIYTLLTKDRAALGEHRKIISVFTITGLLIAMAALDLGHGISLWWVIYHIIPGASVIRAPTRIFLVVLPCLIMAGIIFLDRALISTMPRAVLKPILAMVIVFALFEQRIVQPQAYDALPVRAKDSELAKVFKQYCQVAYVVPRQEGILPLFAYAQVTAMWAGINANIPVINGYSGYSPPGFSLDWQDQRSMLNWLQSQKSPPINRLCFITQQPAKTEAGIAVLATHQSANYTIQVLRYPQLP